MSNDSERVVGCFDPPTADEIASFPRCATCGGIYPLQCPPHVSDRADHPTPEATR